MGRGAQHGAGSSESTAPGDTSEVNAYELAIDTQVEKFLEVKHKLSYFLISASVTLIAFVAHFVVSNFRVQQKFTLPQWELRLVVVSAILGLGAVGLSMASLHLEIKSYQLHLGYRYRRRRWDDLTTKEQKKWDRINKWAARCLRGAFVGLVGEVALAVGFFVAVFW